MDPTTLRRVLTYAPAALAGGATAMQSASAGDELPSTLLKSALVGSTAALAGRYGPEFLKHPVLDTARTVRNNAMDAVRNMRGKGVLSAGIGIPVSVLGGLAGGGIGMAADAALRGLNAPGFNQDNETQYLQALASQGLTDDPSMSYLDYYPSDNTYINPEAYGVSSNTDLARSLMA